MTRCRDLEELITPYVDGETPPAERSEVEGHLRECPGCRDRTGAESTARQVLRARAEKLAVQAPPGLATRCAALANETGRRGLWGLPRWLTVPATAVAVVVVAVVGFQAVASRSATVLASELTLDHLKCFGLFEGTSGPPDAHALESKLHDRYGWEMKVPDEQETGGLTVVGARRCLYHDGGFAHVMYRYGGEPVSLFMLPETSGAPHSLGVMGHQTRIWSVGNTTYAVVMRGDPAVVDQVALRLRQLVR